MLTLALGIGANAAIFSVVRGVLLRPLANRDEDRLIYIRQSARGIGADIDDENIVPGAVISGIAAGAVGGLMLARLVGSYITDVRIPGALPIAAAAGVLVAAGILAWLLSAARASRVDVIQALRSE